MGALVASVASSPKARQTLLHAYTTAYFVLCRYMHAFHCLFKTVLIGKPSLIRMGGMVSELLFCDSSVFTIISDLDSLCMFFSRLFYKKCVQFFLHDVFKDERFEYIIGRKSIDNILRL